MKRVSVFGGVFKIATRRDFGTWGNRRDSHRASHSRTPFKYKALESRQSIRLVIIEPGPLHKDIHLRLTHVLLSDNPEYEALSYAWGDGSQSSDVFLDEDSSLSIGNSTRSSI